MSWSIKDCKLLYQRTHYPKGQEGFYYFPTSPGKPFHSECIIYSYEYLHENGKRFVYGITGGGRLEEYRQERDKWHTEKGWMSSAIRVIKDLGR